MKRRKFFKNLLGAAAIPSLIPTKIEAKEIVPAPQAVSKSTFTFARGSVVDFRGGQGVVLSRWEDSAKIRPLRKRMDLGLGAGVDVWWKKGDKDTPEISKGYATRPAEIIDRSYAYGKPYRSNDEMI